MANARRSTEYSEYAEVDTAPGSGGYFTNPVSMRDNKVRQMFFSIREFDPLSSAGDPGSTVNVTLQFRLAGDVDWQDYLTDQTVDIGCRFLINGGAAGEFWRAGIKQGDYTSGGVVFGFDW